MKETTRGGLKNKILFGFITLALVAGLVFVWRIEPPIQTQSIPVGQSAVQTPAANTPAAGTMQPILQPVTGGQ